MLGIIGGMGPAASSLFYQMITRKTKACCDQENLNLMILSHAGMPDRTTAILSKDESQINDVKDKILADARILQNCGCTALAVTCNTAHYFVNMIEEELEVGFIHMIRETALELAEKFRGKKVAVLATDGTIKTALYQDEFVKQGIVPFVPGKDIQKLVMHEIYDCIKSGLPADEPVWNKIDEDIRAHGCEAAILACTELSVIKSELNLPNYYYDTMEIMADRCIDFYALRGEIKKQEGHKTI